jgi:hypothetical protein
MTWQPAGQKTGSCEYACTFLCSTTLSGDNRNLPTGRKPKRVKEALSRAATGIGDLFVVCITSNRWEPDQQI